MISNLTNTRHLSWWWWRRWWWWREEI